MTENYDEPNANQAISQSSHPLMHIRPFEERDQADVREILIMHHANTVFRDQPFSDAKLRRHMQMVLTRPQRMVAPIVELNGKAVGVAWASADPYMLTDEGLFVAVNVVAVDLRLSAARRAKVFLALVGAVTRWSKIVGAKHCFVHVTTGYEIKATDRLMKAAGARFLGGAYLL